MIRTSFDIELEQRDDAFLTSSKKEKPRRIPTIVLDDVDGDNTKWFE